MELNVTVNEKSIHATVNKIIGDRVEKVIATELGSFVDGHLAKKKLLGKSPPDMNDLIDRRLKLMVQAEVRHRTKDIPFMVQDAIRQTVNDIVRKQLMEASKKAALQLMAKASDGP